MIKVRAFQPAWKRFVVRRHSSPYSPLLRRLGGRTVQAPHRTKQILAQRLPRHDCFPTVNPLDGIAIWPEKTTREVHIRVKNSLASADIGAFRKYAVTNGSFP